MRGIVWLILFGTSINGFAQSESELFKYKKEYPNSYVVVIKNVEEVTLDVVNKDSLAITIRHYEEKIYTNKLISTYNGEATLQYSSFNAITNVEASVEKAVNGKLKNTKVKEFYTKDVLGNEVFYDHQKEISFLFPSLEEGAKTYLKYNEIVKDPHFIGNYFFSSYAPVVSSELVIRYNPAIQINCKLFNVDSTAMTHVVSTDKKYKTQKWTYYSSKEYKKEDNSLDHRYYLPHAVYSITNYTYKGETKEVYSDVKQLYSWYNSMLQDIVESDKAGLKSIVDSLVIGKNTDLDKVKAVYYWVQDHIKYIAFEDGMNGFIPETSSSVCTKRFGDCKGMANLLVDMLGLAGIRAYHTWIGSRDIPYSYEEVPTVYVDNHMICTFIDNGRFYYLDATSKHLSIDHPSAFIQGKQALIGISKDSFRLKEVEIVPASANYTIDTTYTSIRGTVLTGNGKMHINGYVKYDISSYLQNVSDTEAHEYLQWFLQKGNNKFSLKNYKIEGLYDRENDLIVSYDYEIKDYVNINDVESYFNMNLKPLGLYKIEADRQNSYANDYEMSVKNVVIFDLGDLYTVKYLPVDSKFNEKKYSASLSYNRSNKSVVLVQDFIRNYLVLEPSGFSNWNKMVGIFKKAYNESIVLVKK
jgi:transglutaminase-like putative cysteine protease